MLLRHALKPQVGVLLDVSKPAERTGVGRKCLATSIDNGPGRMRTDHGHQDRGRAVFERARTGQQRVAVVVNVGSWPYLGSRVEVCQTGAMVRPAHADDIDTQARLYKHITR